MTSTLPASSLPVHVTNDDGSRYYLRTDPDTGLEQQYWSVTTVLSVKNKDGLKWWAAKLAARRAMDNLPMLIKAQRVDPCGRTWHRTEPLRCERCPDCVQRWVELFHVGESERRKHEGSAIHNAIESWIKLGTWRDPVDLAQPYLERHPDIVKALPPYLAACRQWVEDFGLLPEDFWASEMTVYNHVHKYAGTCDGALWLSPRTKKAARLMAQILGRPPRPGERILVIFDCKTREGEGTTIYDDHPLQVTAYRHAQTCRPSKDADREFPMPATHGAVIFQARPDGYAFRPVRTGTGEFKAFLAALELYRWTANDGAASFAAGSFPTPEGFAWPLPDGDDPVGEVAAADVPGELPAAPAARAKVTGPCSACGAEKSVTRAGVITTRHAPCPGAGKPPKAAETFETPGVAAQVAMGPVREFQAPAPTSARAPVADSPIVATLRRQADFRRPAGPFDTIDDKDIPF